MSTRLRISRQHRRGQTLAEFAIVFPVFMLLLGGMIQLGLIFWGSNTLNQVVRDAGRYSATLQSCSPGLVTDAATPKGRVAALSSASAGAWRLDPASINVSYYTTSLTTGSAVTPTVCPPDNNATVTWVHIDASSDVFVFFPLIPGNGRISSSVDFRMEPKP